MRSPAPIEESFADDEIRRLHNELQMPVGEFGALAAAVFMALSLVLVTHPLSKIERIHITALGHDAMSHARDESRRIAKVHESRFGISSADALTGSFVVRSDARTGRHS
jgi:hypothetical protein